MDTDTCIYWLNERGNVKAKAETHQVGDLAISIITAAELFFGAENSQRIEENLRQIRELLRYLNIIQLDLPVAARYGHLRAVLKSKGTPVADLDLFIASTALEYQVPLVTNNTRHYQNIPGLVLENWLT